MELETSAIAIEHLLKIDLHLKHLSLHLYAKLNLHVYAEGVYREIIFKHIDKEVSAPPVVVRLLGAIGAIHSPPVA